MNTIDSFMSEVERKGGEFVKELNKRNNSADFSYSILHSRLEYGFWFVLSYKNISIYGEKFEEHRVVEGKDGLRYFYLNDVEYLNDFISKIQEDLEKIDKNFVISKIGVY